MKKYKTSIKACSLWIVIIVLIVLIGYFIFHIIPCDIWNNFKGYKKSIFFGSYYGSVISALLALGGVAISLFINTHQTNKVIKEADERSRNSSREANKRTNKVLKESHNKLQKEKINNLDIEIMITNYKILNGLMIHVQQLNSDFFKSLDASKDVLSHTDFSSNDAFYDVMMRASTPIKLVLRKQLLKDINMIDNTIKEYHSFKHIYASQLQRVFINTSYLHGYEDCATSCLSKLDKDVHEAHSSFYTSITSRNSKAQKIGMIKTRKHINGTISDLSSLDGNSLDFGTELEKYLKEK